MNPLINRQIARSYHCTRKADKPCSELYLREELLAKQCLEKLSPFALSSNEAAEIHTLIDAQSKKEQDSLIQAMKKTEVHSNRWRKSSVNSPGAFWTASWTKTVIRRQKKNWWLKRPALSRNGNVSKRAANIHGSNLLENS